MTVQLYECDPQTNKAIYRKNTANNNNDNSNAMTTSLGYDSTYRPQLAPKDAGGGNWNMIDIKSDRSYFVKVVAPERYAFSSGVCNDDIMGHECLYNENAANKFASGYDNRRRRGRRIKKKRRRQRLLLRGGAGTYAADYNIIRNLQQSPTNLGGGKFGSSSTLFEPTEDEIKLSVKEGRSVKCVSVDSSGMPDARIDMGVMRFGDVTFTKTQVDIKMDLIEPKSWRRGLQDIFELKDEDKYAIGIVTLLIFGN